MSEITHFNKNGNPACPWERHKEICTVNDVKGKRSVRPIGRKAKLDERFRPIACEVWQDGRKLHSFTGPLRVQSATQYATMLLGGASKDSMTVCSADLGGRPVPKTFDTGFNPCIFET